MGCPSTPQPGRDRRDRPARRRHLVPELGPTGAGPPRPVARLPPPPGRRPGPGLVQSVRAHLGRLLAYALPASAGTAAQKALIAEALTWRPLPASKRGSAPTVKGLARSWATDPAYAAKIVNIANTMLKA